jgi:hypothetical protein
MMPSPAASQRRNGIRSCRKISDKGTTHMVVVFARIAVRPAGTQTSASCANAKYNPSCPTPIASIAGRSARRGRRNLPSTASRMAAVPPDSTARPSANHIGVLPRLRANLVSGHALLSKITDAASWISPAAGNCLPPSNDGAVRGIDTSTERDIRNR